MPAKVKVLVEGFTNADSSAEKGEEKTCATMECLKTQKHWNILEFGIKTLHMKKVFLAFSIFILLGVASEASALMPRLIYSQKGDIQINSPEFSQAFYDELKGQPRNYFISSEKDFNLYLNLLVPEFANPVGKYSAEIFSIKDGEELYVARFSEPADWQEFYEPFGRDYYLKGPELDKTFPAGKYKIEVFSKDNLGKYVLAVGKQEVFPLPESLNIFWQLPLLKINFFKTSVLQFFFTPFGIAGVSVIFGLVIILAVLNYFVSLIVEKIKNSSARTILLTSAGMQMKDEIIKLLQKPTYDVNVAFITTAYKYKLEENPEYVAKDLLIMKELGFNVEEIDIEGKNKNLLMKLFENKDIIFVEGGNTFYLLKAIRQSGFEKVIKKLLKKGRVYVGVSAGSIVAGKTIETAGWKDGDKNFVKLKNLKGMNLVPFNIFVHYRPEHAEIIKQKIKNPDKRRKRLRILTDYQAILIQGSERILIGKGEAIIL